MKKLVSVIIPTYRRPSSVVSKSIRSILEDTSAQDLISEVILIDQNVPELVLEPDLVQTGYKKIKHNQTDILNLGKDAKLLHLFGLAPSVTKAKNLGERFARGTLYVFFDDDVTVLPGSIQNYVEILESQKAITYLGGREIIDRGVRIESKIRAFFRKIIQNYSRGESEYKSGGVYVGRIKPNSFMIKNFNVETPNLVKIDGARGCNWACRASAFKVAGGFDENYQGSAMREETDLYIRLNRLPGVAFYTAKSAVIHHRQAGGCDNLSDSIRSLTSKFENELYFQKKNFPNIPGVYFQIRTMPLMLESLSESRGLSFWIWLKCGWKAW